MTIADLGPGIPAEVLPEIFDPYFSTKATRGPRGTGLGLTVCRAIVDQHGGTLTVDSTVGVGTTVRIESARGLPAVRARRAPPATPRGPGTGRLLVMDDEQSGADHGGRAPPTAGLHGGVDRRAAAEVVALTKRPRRAGTPFAAVILDFDGARGDGGRADPRGPASTRSRRHGALRAAGTPTIRSWWEPGPVRVPERPRQAARDRRAPRPPRPSAGALNRPVPR